MDYRLELKNELLDKALTFGDFTLASGQKSTYYINCKPVTLGAKGSYLCAENLLALIPENIKAVGGLTLGADPLVSSLTLLSYQKDRPLQGFLVRKETKGHGTGKQIENLPPEGTEVVIVDDVITTGGSALKAAEIALENNLKVSLALSLVDRKGGGEEAFSKLGIPMKAVFDINELLAERP